MMLDICKYVEFESADCNQTEIEFTVNKLSERKEKRDAGLLYCEEV